MPNWLLQIIVTLAIRVGVPELVKLFPKIPQEVIDIINKLLDALNNPTVSNSSAKKMAISQVRDYVVGQAPDTKES